MMNKTKCDFLGEFGLFQLQPNPPPLRACTHARPLRARANNSTTSDRMVKFQKRTAIFWTILVLWHPSQTVSSLPCIYNFMPTLYLQLNCCGTNYIVPQRRRPFLAGAGVIFPGRAASHCLQACGQNHGETEQKYKTAEVQKYNSIFVQKASHCC